VHQDLVYINSNLPYLDVDGGGAYEFQVAVTTIKVKNHVEH
jgi:hypothetical protein